jgi:hypothetical protein
MKKASKRLNDLKQEIKSLVDETVTALIWGRAVKVSYVGLLTKIRHELDRKRATGSFWQKITN